MAGTPQHSAGMGTIWALAGHCYDCGAPATHVYLSIVPLCGEHARIILEADS